MLLIVSLNEDVAKPMIIKQELESVFLELALSRKLGIDIVPYPKLVY